MPKCEGRISNLMCSCYQIRGHLCKQQERFLPVKSSRRRFWNPFPEIIRCKTPLFSVASDLPPPPTFPVCSGISYYSNLTDYLTPHLCPSLRLLHIQLHVSLRCYYNIYLKSNLSMYNTPNLSLCTRIFQTTSPDDAPDHNFVKIKNRFPEAPLTSSWLPVCM